MQGNASKTAGFSVTKISGFIVACELFCKMNEKRDNCL